METISAISHQDAHRRWQFEQYLHDEGRTLRVQVKQDASNPFQSAARVSVWSTGTLEWNEVGVLLNTGWTEWTESESEYGTAGISEAVATLLAIATAILDGPTAVTPDIPGSPFSDSLLPAPPPRSAGEPPACRCGDQLVYEERHYATRSAAYGSDGHLVVHSDERCNPEACEGQCLRCRGCGAGYLLPSAFDFA